VYETVRYPDGSVRPAVYMPTRRDNDDPGPVYQTTSSGAPAVYIPSGFPAHRQAPEPGLPSINLIPPTPAQSNIASSDDERVPRRVPYGPTVPRQSRFIEHLEDRFDPEHDYTVVNELGTVPETVEDEHEQEGGEQQVAVDTPVHRTSFGAELLHQLDTIAEEASSSQIDVSAPAESTQGRLSGTEGLDSARGVDRTPENDGDSVAVESTSEELGDEHRGPVVLPHEEEIDQSLFADFSGAHANSEVSSIDSDLWDGKFIRPLRRE